MNKKLLLLIIALSIFTISGIIGLFLFPFSPFYHPQSPSQISKPAPVKIGTLQGEIVELNDHIISVVQDGTTYSLPSSSIKNVHRLTSGSVENGDAQTIDAKKADLEIGQTVFIIAERNLSRVRAIYIVK